MNCELDIWHVAGKENVVADCLTRPPEVLSLPRSTKVASVKLVAPVAQDGSPGSESIEKSRTQLSCTLQSSTLDSRPSMSSFVQGEGEGEGK